MYKYEKQYEGGSNIMEYSWGFEPPGGSDVLFIVITFTALKEAG